MTDRARSHACVDDADGAGLLAFARFAYPPNSRGLCGPDQPAELFERASAGVADPDLRRLALGFEGAWPYLQLIAGSIGCEDPFAARVVDAYWIGGPLADQVAPRLVSAVADELSSAQRASHREMLQCAVVAGLPPTHAFHVFAVYPWVGLLREGRADPAIEILDSCRIRWGEVLGIEGDTALVRSRHLHGSPQGLILGAPVVDTVRLGTAGATLVPGVAPGDHVALHWDWICDQLDQRRLGELQRQTRRCLDVVNGLLNTVGRVGARWRDQYASTMA